MGDQYVQSGRVVDPGEPVGDPVTGYESKLVMLRAERHDEIVIEDTVERIRHVGQIPDRAVVAQRTNTYFGPKLKLYSGNVNYLLTAPGPDSHLLLWVADTNVDGFRQGWHELAEVKANLADDLPNYDLCPYCGEPLKTLEHEQLAATGDCSLS